MCQDELCKWIGTKDKILKNETSLWLIQFSRMEGSLKVIWRSTDPDFLEYCWMYYKSNDLWILRLLIILTLLNFENDLYPSTITRKTNESWETLRIMYGIRHRCILILLLLQLVVFVLTLCPNVETLHICFNSDHSSHDALIFLPFYWSKKINGRIKMIILNRFRRESKGFLITIKINTA